MHEIVVNLHMHTRYSDGHVSHDQIAKAALKAGLDAVIVTDHNVWVNGPEDYYQDGDRRLLLLVGEEIHDQARQPQKNHLLVFGANRELSSLAYDPQSPSTTATATPPATGPWWRSPPPCATGWARRTSWPRIGGDEFAPLLIQADALQVQPVVERLCEAVAAQELRDGDAIVQTTLSAGIALYPAHGADTEELLSRADAALYDAKRLAASAPWSPPISRPARRATPTSPPGQAQSTRPRSSSQAAGSWPKVSTSIS